LEGGGVGWKTFSSSSSSSGPWEETKPLAVRLERAALAALAWRFLRDELLTGCWVLL